MQPEQQQRIMGYFIEEAKDHLNTIEQGLLNLQRTIDDPEMVNEMFRAAHSVKGGAAMLGLHGIQQVSHRLEDFFKILKDNAVQVDQTMESAFLQVFDALKEFVDQLQTPFGLTEEKTQVTLAGVEPVFAALEQQLSTAAMTPRAVAPIEFLPDLAAAPTPVFVQTFRDHVSAQLREMLDLFKQPEANWDSRQRLQAICDRLYAAGTTHHLPTWCHLIESAKRAIAAPENTYRTLAPVIIKDIKQAQELILAGRANDIAPGAQLLSLVPITAAQAPIESDFGDMFADIDDGTNLVETSAPADEFFLGTSELSMATDRQQEEPDFDLGAAFSEASLASAADYDGDGPKVGIEELNTLADLFEGEMPDLGATWQEEELLGESPDSDVFNANALADLEDSSDFSDLLFAEPTANVLATQTSSEEDLNDLFGDVLDDDLEVTEASDALGSLGLNATPTPDLNDFMTGPVDDQAGSLGDLECSDLDHPFSDLDQSDRLIPAAPLTALVGAPGPEIKITDPWEEDLNLDAGDAGTTADDLGPGREARPTVDQTALDEAEMDLDLGSLDEWAADNATFDFDDLMLSEIGASPSLEDENLEVLIDDGLDQSADDFFGALAPEAEITAPIPTETFIQSEIPDPWSAVAAPSTSDRDDRHVFDDLNFNDREAESAIADANALGELSLADAPDDSIDLSEFEELNFGTADADSDLESWGGEAATELAASPADPFHLGAPATATPADPWGLDAVSEASSEFDDFLSASENGSADSELADDLLSRDAASPERADLWGARLTPPEDDLFGESLTAAADDLFTEGDLFGEDDLLGEPAATTGDDGLSGNLDSAETALFGQGLTAAADEAFTESDLGDLFGEDDLLGEPAASAGDDLWGGSLDSTENDLFGESLGTTADDVLTEGKLFSEDDLFAESADGDLWGGGPNSTENDLFGESLDSTENDVLGSDLAAPADDLLGDNDLFSESAPAPSAEEFSLANAAGLDTPPSDARDDQLGADAGWGEDWLNGHGEEGAGLEPASADAPEALLTEAEASVGESAATDFLNFAGDAPTEFTSESALGDLDFGDSFGTTEPSAPDRPDDFSDLGDWLGDSAESADDLADLDNFLDGNFLDSSGTETADELSDLDELLADGEPAPNLNPFGVVGGIVAGAAAGGILAANLAGETAVDQDFADLDALLENTLPAEAETAFDLAHTESMAEFAGGGSTGFDELDDLLKEAEEHMGGGPMVTGRDLAPQARRAARSGRGLGEQTMRVPVKQLDNLSNLVGELVVNRNSLEQDQERLRQSLDNLLYQVQQLSDVGQRMQDLYERSLLESSLLAGRHNQRAFPSSHRDVSVNPATNVTDIEYDPLEMDRFTGFHSLSQEMIELIVRVRESSSDIEFIVDETDQVTRMFRQVTTQLQEGLTRSRMVPFAQTADRLPRAVRDISMKVGKQAELVIEGRETLIDKMILEHLYDPMTHLVNNALTHGIESPEVRRAAGKAPAGRITVRAFHQGNQTIISVSDDGAGIDVDFVKAKAIEKGLMTPLEAQQMTRLDVYDLLFHAGFTTKDQADDFSGRGVGMDVVRTSLSEIRGVIHTDSNTGKGTTFTIRLPLTLSISKALCCISDRARIAFPMDGVEDMLDIPKERMQTNAEGQPCIAWRDTLLPLYPLTDLLGYNRHLSRGNVYGGTQEDDIVSVVVLRSAGNYLALQVDNVLGEQEIVIKQLEGPVPKPVGVAGATVLGDGRIMPIADVLELIDLSMGRIRKDASGALWDQGGPTTLSEPTVIKTEPTVLIVDDSITVRELLSMTFNKVGYRVEQARDGQEAWEKLRSGLPCDIVFCDIEMPRMDGLELLSRIQKDPSLSGIPIAMLTSRGADRHRQMAASLGASGYFTKPYLEEALLDAAQRMLKGEVLIGATGNP